MTPDSIRLGLLPGLLLLPLTLLRAWLEVERPEAAYLSFVSTNVAMLVVLIALAVALGRRGASFPHAIGVLATFLLVVRVPLAAIYGLAVGQGWTTPAGEPVRYVMDVREMDMFAEPTGWKVFAVTAILPTTIFLIGGIVIFAVALKLGGARTARDRVVSPPR